MVAKYSSIIMKLIKRSNCRMSLLLGFCSHIIRQRRALNKIAIIQQQQLRRPFPFTPDQCRQLRQSSRLIIACTVIGRMDMSMNIACYEYLIREALLYAHCYTPLATTFSKINYLYHFNSECNNILQFTNSYRLFYSPLIESPYSWTSN
ncbi:hypothetical protein D3C78_1102990 [compost metagenome]